MTPREARQSRVEQYITSRVRQYWPPTFREVSLALNIPVGTLHSDIKTLELQGRVARAGNGRPVFVVAPWRPSKWAAAYAARGVGL
jgi:hypothetical protein